MQKNKTYRLILYTGILLLFCASIPGFFISQSLPDIAENSSKSISEKAARARRLVNSPQTLSELNATALSEIFIHENIGLYFFHKDSIYKWNNSRIPLKEGLAAFPDSAGFIQLKHGYYLYLQNRVAADTVILALLLVKPVYELQNNYLQNGFADWLGIPKDIELREKGAEIVPVRWGSKVLFSIGGTEKRYHDKGSDLMACVLFLLGFFCLAAAFLLKIRQGMAGPRFVGSLLGLLIARLLMTYLQWPAFLYRTEFYDVSIFGNARSFLNGFLGDMLLNALLLLFIAAALSLYFGKLPQSSRLRKTELIINSILLFLLLNAFNHSVKSLVANSTLSFDFFNVLVFRSMAFAGLAVLCFYALAMFVCLCRMAVLAGTPFLKGAGKIILITTGAGIVQGIFSNADNYLVECFWPVLLSLCIYFLVQSGRFSLSLALGVQILIMSLITSRFLNTYIAKNEKEELELLSVKLSEREDPILESEYSLLPKRLAADVNLENLIRILPASVDGIESLLKQRYFSGYFDRYNIAFALFDRDCHPLLPVSDGVLDNLDFFEDEIKVRSDSTSVSGLYFVRDFHKNTRYIGKISLKEKKLYVLMQAKQYEELGSFPDLLLDRSQQKQEKLKGFSHAVYRSQQLSSHFGALNYPFFLQDSATLAASNPRFISHFYKPEEGSVIVISEEAKRWNYFFTVNSYLLLFFSLISYACYLAYASLFTSQFNTSSLTRRIQTVIIVLLLVAMSAIGYTSGNLVTGQFENDNKRLLEEKTQVIISELSSQFSQEQFFDESRKELINLKLKEYARLFNTPISLFNRAGYLSNTSEPKLYELGLSASLVNPKVYSQLKNNFSSAEIVVEKAGTLDYYSFYTPVFNTGKKLLGFVNLPYFAKQSALVNELSNIISALINVYVLLFVISIFAGLILAGYITQPLRLIKQQIANISLGKQNEKISWQSNDEIGRLVAEYNEMLLKLEQSANLLAQSERESAWREMAKQVAHEIKNPLTPMKLNLQYLQHVMKEDPADFKEKFAKSSLAIIEQIDSLANIATEFSNFAKLPGTSLQPVNLVEIIAASVLIFDPHKNIDFHNLIPDRELIVQGDRDQCLRVFNNIFKNAIQALEDVAKPEIWINCEKTDSEVIISVKDNGCGIDEDLKSRLFTPNFTTKSAGSGLGLAMVSNIMEGFGGKIWFESERGSGTVFYLEFKK